jgi:4-carboxymuconolactone decarboxylase
VTQRPVTPRISPVPVEEYDDAIREILDDAGPDFVTTSNIFGTLLRNPTITKHFRRFGDALRNGELPVRHRELLVLRTCWRCNSAYEWAQHARISRSAGLTDDEITAVARYPEADLFDEFELALICAADELHDDACVTDRTWATLSGRYDQRQLLELLMLVGSYTMLAFVMNSAGVQPEPGSDPLPQL